MIQMIKGTTTINMKFDAFGNRVSKTVTTAGVPTTMQYLVDDLNPTGYQQVLDELTGAIRLASSRARCPSGECVRPGGG